MFKDPGETNEQTQEPKTESGGRCSICMIIRAKTDIGTGCEIGFGNPVMLLWVNRPQGKNCFSFPEIGRIGMGWEDVVMNLWRQQHPYPHRPGRCQAETRWQIFYRKRNPSAGGTVLVQEVCMSGANTPLVRNGSQPFLSSYCVLSQPVMRYHPGHSHCRSLEHVPGVYGCMTNHYKT